MGVRTEMPRTIIVSINVAFSPFPKEISGASRVVTSVHLLVGESTRWMER